MSEKPDDYLSPRGGLDPQVKALLQLIEQQNAPPLNTQTPAQVREEWNAALALVKAQGLDGLDSIANISIPGPGGQIRLRTYTPRGSPPFPILVYFHGGGFVLESLDSHDGLCRTLARKVSCIVVSVDYRLAPETKFPAAVHDAYAATCWVAENARHIQGDPARIAVGGDSAGGNLATVVSLIARDRGGPSLVYQWLAYPVTDLSFLDTASYQECAQGYGMTRADMVWYRDHYLACEADARNPLASPLLAPDLRGLPPALVMTAEFDILRDGGEAYARRLQQAGVPATCKRYDGLIHAFLGMEGLVDRVRDALDDAAAALRAAFRI